LISSMLLASHPSYSRTSTTTPAISPALMP
jgi:hypothetical protein